MSSERLAMIDHVVERGISAGGYPGAAVVVGRRGAAVWEKGFGKLSWEQRSSRRHRRPHDLRSRVADQGRRHHDRAHGPVRRGQDPPRRSGLEVRPRVCGRRQGSRHGSHAPRASLRPSGRPRPLAHRAVRPPKRATRSSQTPLACEPGRCYEYSDLGADMLGFVVEAAAGRAARPVPRRSASSGRSA